MMNLRAISFEQLTDIVEDVFADDTAMQQNTAVVGEGAEIAMDNLTKIAAASYDLLYLAVEDEGKTIGFSCVCFEPIPLLFSFGIKVEHRTSDIKTAWMDALKEMFGGLMFIVANDYNTRAVSFFKKHGFEVAEHNEQDKSILLLWQLQPPQAS